MIDSIAPLTPAANIPVTHPPKNLSFCVTRISNIPVTNRHKTTYTLTKSRITLPHLCVTQPPRPHPPVRLHWIVPLRPLLISLALALCSTAADLPDPAHIRQAAATVTKNLAVQSRLPNSAGTPEAATRRPSLDRDTDAFSVPAPAAILSLLQWVVVAVVVLAILALLAIVFREPVESRFHPVLSPADHLPDAPPPPADPRDLLARADQLAAAGYFAEAMHCVLLAAMTILGHTQPRKSVGSFTSWELLRSAALAPPQLHALRDLVLRVERAWFGHRPAALDDYQQVRATFDAFASPPTEIA